MHGFQLLAPQDVDGGGIEGDDLAKQIEDGPENVLEIEGPGQLPPHLVKETGLQTFPAESFPHHGQLEQGRRRGQECSEGFDAGKSLGIGVGHLDVQDGLSRKLDGNMKNPFGLQVHGPCEAGETRVVELVQDPPLRRRLHLSLALLPVERNEHPLGLSLRRDEQGEVPGRPREPAGEPAGAGPGEGQDLGSGQVKKRLEAETRIHCG